MGTPIRSTAPTARRPRDPRRRTRRDDSSTVAPAEPSPARRCTARTGGAMIVLWFHPAVQLHMLCLCEGRSEVGVELLELLLGGRGDLLVFGDLVNDARWCRGHPCHQLADRYRQQHGREYITGGIDAEYLAHVEQLRNDKAKAKSGQQQHPIDG